MKQFDFDCTFTRIAITSSVFILLLLASASLLPAQTTPVISQKSAGDAALVETAQPALAQSSPQLIADFGLPDAPGEGLWSGTTVPSRPKIAPYQPPPVATLYDKYISPGQKAQRLTTSNKLFFGVHQLISPYLLLSVATAAGYEHALNGSPNYGTDSGAYGQRVGAAAIRDASQSIFSDSIMATVLHEDPRYYEMGHSHSALARAGYAVSRVLVTRSDAGAATPNFALLSGYAGAAALENAYYPTDNHGAAETVKSFAGSLGGAAFSNVIREFLPDILHAVHLER